MNFIKSWIVDIYFKNHPIQNFILIINQGNSDIIFLLFYLFLPFIYYRLYNLISFPILYNKIPNKQKIIKLTNCYLFLIICVFNSLFPLIYTILNHSKRLCNKNKNASSK